MKDITLVIMAAGMGSRFGGVKQLEPVGPSGEIIMDYSIYDAIQAGFNKVVFIIRKELEADFRKVLGDRIEKKIRVEYIFQELDNIPGDIKEERIQERKKPWGTGHAVYCCKDLVKEPFAVINADDYYGRQAFEKIYEFLSRDDLNEKNYCMAGYNLSKTLSEYGSVTRGICKVDNLGKLISIAETTGIELQNGKLVADGKYADKIAIDINNIASMNIWGFNPGIFEFLEKEFKHFLLDPNNRQKEFFLPSVVNQLITEGIVEVNVLNTDDKWYGVTYKEDKPFVVEGIKKLVKEGKYPEKLFD